jgi:hypothetical protein
MRVPLEIGCGGQWKKCVAFYYHFTIIIIIIAIWPQ